MNPELKQLLSDTPFSVAFTEFDSPNDIDLRRSCVDVLFVNTIGINADTADWLPNDDPPDPKERLAWLWFIRPDLATDFVDMINGDFRLLVEYYRDGRIDDWWSHMTTDQQRRREKESGPILFRSKELPPRRTRWTCDGMQGRLAGWFVLERA